jgi:hypothetical protein
VEDRDWGVTTTQKISSSIIRIFTRRTSPNGASPVSTLGCMKKVSVVKKGDSSPAVVVAEEEVAAHDLPGSSKL